MNNYERAIFEAGSVLETYSLGKKFTMFGFGGIPKYLEAYKGLKEKDVVKCWNLLGELEKSEAERGNELKVQGVMGALGLYHKAIRKTELAGPTYFAGMLKRFLNMIEFEREKYEKTYFVLMILTDGCIHDMPETKQLIVELSYQPCSIVIIGIGEEDFTHMETLDADTMVLVDNIGRPAARDIVQFVKFNDLTEMARVEV